MTDDMKKYIALVEGKLNEWGDYDNPTDLIYDPRGVVPSITQHGKFFVIMDNEKGLVMKFSLADALAASTDQYYIEVYDQSGKKIIAIAPAEVVDNYIKTPEPYKWTTEF